MERAHRGPHGPAEGPALRLRGFSPPRSSPYPSVFPGSGRPLSSSMCRRTAVCCLWCELGPRPGRHQALDETLATLGLGTLPPSGPPPAAAGATIQGRFLGSTWLLLTGRGAGNTPPGWGADWASESTDPSPIFLLPKGLGRQMPRERFLLSLLWGLAKQQPWVERGQVNETLNNVKF